MIKNLLVEGPDCSGKTTLVNYLRNLIRWDSRSLHHVEGNQFDRYLEQYASANNVVFDRGHFSEAVYSELWKRPAFLENEKNILDQITGFRFLVIFSCPDLDRMVYRYKERKEPQQLKLNELHTSRQLFIKSFENIKHLRYHSGSYEELRAVGEKIQEMIK